MKVIEKHYYRYMGYTDGSGIPQGWIIKVYTEKEVECYLLRSGQVYQRVD